MIDKLHVDPNRRGVGYISFLAFLERILRLAELKTLKEKLEIAGEVSDRRNIFENFIETLSKKPLVRIALDIEKMRHIHDFFDPGIRVPGSLAGLDRIKH